MSLEAMVWVYREAPIPRKTPRGVPNPGVLTAALLCLADGYSEETGLAFRSLSNVAKYTRMNERTIRDAVRLLEELGILEYHEEDQAVIRAIVKRPDWRPNGYRINFDAPLLRYDDEKGRWVPDNNGGVAHPPVTESAGQRGGRSPARKPTGGSLTRNGGVAHPQRGGRSPGKLKGNSRGNSRGGSSAGAEAPAAAPPASPPENLESELEGQASPPSPPSPPVSAAPPPAAPAPDPAPPAPPTGRTDGETHPPALPSRHCAAHPGGTSEPCGPCADARKAHTAAAAALEEQRRTATTRAQDDARRARQLAVAACPCCNEHGYRLEAPAVVCDHVPNRAEINQRGIAQVRAALAAKKRVPVTH